MLRHIFDSKIKKLRYQISFIDDNREFHFLIKLGELVKHECPQQQQYPKLAIFRKKVMEVIDLGVIWKGFIGWVYMPNMKSLSLAV